MLQILTGRDAAALGTTADLLSSVRAYLVFEWMLWLGCTRIFYQLGKSARIITVPADLADAASLADTVSSLTKVSLFS